MSRDGVASIAGWMAARTSPAEWRRARVSAAVGPRLALLAVAACGWPRDRFESDGIEILCAAASACAATYDAPTCIAALAVPLEGCVYAPDMGADCVAQLEEAACVEVEPFGDLALEVPPTCGMAFDCGDLDWLAPVRIE